MTGNLFLNWASIAISIFNTILLIWLGLTVVLNSQRRTAGIWIVASQLFLGGVFFLSHTVILSQPLLTSGPDLNFWWQVGWLPVVALPYAWYAVMLWYAGFWDNRNSRLYRRHIYFFFLASAMAVIVTGMVYLANPFPSITQLLRLDILPQLSILGMPLIILIYPVYIGACIGLSVDALRHPAPSARMMGELARQRARPWLMSASVVLLAVGLLVGGIMMWTIMDASAGLMYPSFANTVIWFDLVIAALIAGAIWMVGQAIVSYEVFTGHSLPRRGLRRHWNRMIILAAGFSLVVSGGLVYELSGIYLLLLSALLLSVFYALISWRSFIEREEYLTHLRPFVRSQKLLEQLLSPASPDLPDSLDSSPFQSLCSDLLRAKQGVLIPSGSFPQVFGKPEFYPANFSPDLPDTSEITAQISSPSTLSVPLQPSRWQGLLWALPLWSDRGLVGLLLLGEKRDGGLYTQEEFEIARAAGERLLDTQASLELSRRLFALQRQRLSQDQLLDHQTRRILHDDILPLLHTAMLSLDKTSGNHRRETEEALETLASIHREIASLIREIPRKGPPELAQLGLTEALRRLIDNELPDVSGQVTWQLDPEAEQRAGTLPEWALEVVYYAAREAIRNANRHATRDRSNDSLFLDICLAWKKGLEIRIRNNGITPERQAEAAGGSGQGLSLHSTMMAVIGGTLTLESTPDLSTQVVIYLPEQNFQDLVDLKS